MGNTNQRTEEALHTIKVNGTSLVYLKITDADMTYYTVRLFQNPADKHSIYIEDMMGPQFSKDMRNGVVNNFDFLISTVSVGSVSVDELQTLVEEYQNAIDTVTQIKVQMDMYQYQLVMDSKK